MIYVYIINSNTRKLFSSFLGSLSQILKLDEKKNGYPASRYKNNIFLGVDTSKLVAGRILSPEETRQSVLNSKEIKKSKKNWHFWFKVRGGHRITWQHFCGSPYTFQQAHHIFKTGRF